MRWQNQRRSDNVRDRRGAGGAAGGAGIGLILMLLRFIFTKFGIFGIVIVVGGYFALQAVGINPLTLLTGAQPQATSQRSATAADDEYFEMMRAIVGSTEDVWVKIFREENLNGGVYPKPFLNLFSNGTQSGCGYAPSSVGPFYCPADKEMYVDPTFFKELQTKFRVPGDFPPAYVVAHEVGHHVQTVVGISAQVRQTQSRSSKVEQNRLQVRMELQADCFAGLWAHNWRQGIEPGDIQEALRAAEAIGDDALQVQAGREVDHDAFTHGSSAQRQRWFTIGYQSGDYNRCDTFAPSYQAL